MRQIRGWLEEDTEVLVGSRPEAEFHTAALTAMLSHGSNATGTGSRAAYLDWSKESDTVDLSLLDKALSLVTGLVKMALSMYRAIRAIEILMP